ncbi:hypothetical protein VTJ49DRAFT_3397 [Mycothermus thermophilus]|uniref:NmrA-like domain-containing protein n=1 Tax=Humicola insolens TaxID=85995 RepID=A0ABR3V7T7_HUMIN
MSNTKLIVVTGATGAQGGGVVNVMKKTPGWRIRAVTRNPESDAAKQLMADGTIEVVRADYDDEASLGAAAIFAVTNFWEPLFPSGASQHEAGAIEERHGMNLARAAAQTSTLEHYLWSTQPSAREATAGEHEVPHLDYKARVDERIREELPELAAKTTYLYFGYYPQNMVYFPLLRPVEDPETGSHIQTLPMDPDSKILVAGDMTVNPGIWVRQILATAPAAEGKYTRIALERLSFREMMDGWSAATGRKGVIRQVSEEEWTRMWGVAGTELAWQFRFGEMCDPWAKREGDGKEFVGPEELGIDPKEVVGFEETVRGLVRKGLVM